MAGYAVIARIDRVEPHFAGWEAEGAIGWATAEPLGPEAIDLVGPAVGDTLSERWERIREALRQTTFYLFDPQSWR
jgi:hypothetical protein